ncbi:unnamed protein product [Penicillium egyptiacum]|uniref:RBR-type E3 ubiquitin transferase n=1 Tax=Penicillium egyptiacum TaxID=1303716 RepID=A0A9W4K8A8_9EURO|nr:unnamed protein product [Penicillium egyptiacum]
MNTSRAIVQLGESLMKIGGFRKRRSKKTLTAPKVEVKKSAAPEYTVSNDDVAETSKEETETRHECTSCTEQYPLSDIIQTECAHNYCRECIPRLFENSLTDEALFPPRCCRMPICVSTAVEDMIGIEMMKRYEGRKTEVSDSQRTYCANSTCSRYILPQNIRRGVGTCEFCSARTCTDCQKQAHRGDCNEKNKRSRRASDEKANDDLLEALAKKKKWQRCPKCSRIIERVNGCLSM